MDAEVATEPAGDGDAEVAVLRSRLDSARLSESSDHAAPEDGERTGREDAEEGEGAAAAPALTYRWQLVRPGAENGLTLPPLVFAADILAKEANNKRWKPQGPVKKLMESYHLYMVKKPPTHHKNAKYVCRVCDMHWDTLLAVQKHVSEQRHAANTRRHEEVTAVNTLPGPTPAQAACLTALLTALYQQHGLTPERLGRRRQAADQLQTTVLDGLRQRFDGDECTLEAFGSARHGCGFASSCLDLALLTPDDSPGAAQLTHVIQVLQDSDLFTDVTHDFHSWVPNVRCVHAASGQECLVGLGAGRDVQLAQVVQLYTALEPRTAPLAVALRHLAKVCEMDRPHAGSLPPSAFVLMTIYYLQQCEPPVLPVLHELAGDPQADPPVDLDIAAAEAAAASWRTSNTDDLGTLWLRLLRFYALELTDSDVVVSIRQLEPITRADKGWGNKKVSIEDPIQSKRNISRSISSSAVADVIVDRLRGACLLFGVPRTSAGAAVSLQPASGPPPPAETAEMDERLSEIGQEEMQYGFDTELLCGQTSMPLVCSVCQKTGHVTDDCPTLVVPPPEPLPPPPDQQTDLLDRICASVFNDWAPPSEEYLIRQNMLEGIEGFIRHQAFPSARLTLFGSSVNGFGFRNSDLDICMTFEDCEDSQALDQAEIIRKLALILSRLRSVCNIIPISTAKVPIVKFTDRRSRLEGDISLYNTLAQHNTLLLHTYAKLDNRARILGYMVKLMAKICDICDASRGSLSSYAYTLLLIYYLQRCEPPVLPVLQQLDAAGRTPRLVDGADVSFFSDLDKLRKHWPGVGRNKSSIGELWVGFLRFYGEEFDFERHVVCIRQRDVLTKFEKLWNGAFIAIEDPFLLSHNLGGGVRKKMAAFIRRTLLSWRRHHIRSIPSPLPHGYRDVRAYLMSGEHLCEGPPPNASGCHACGRIGHWASDCPRRRGRGTPGKGKPRGPQPASPAKPPAPAQGPSRSPAKTPGQGRAPAQSRAQTRAAAPNQARVPAAAAAAPVVVAAAGATAAAAAAAASAAAAVATAEVSAGAAVAGQAAAPAPAPAPAPAVTPKVASAVAAAAAAAAGAAPAPAPAPAAAAAAKKARKRQRRRKPDGAVDAETQRSVVFYNSKQRGGEATPADAVSL